MILYYIIKLNVSSLIYSMQDMSLLWILFFSKSQSFFPLQLIANWLPNYFSLIEFYPRCQTADQNTTAKETKQRNSKSRVENRIFTIYVGRLW